MGFCNPISVARWHPRAGLWVVLLGKWGLFGWSFGFRTAGAGTSHRDRARFTKSQGNYARVVDVAVGANYLYMRAAMALFDTIVRYAAAAAEFSVIFQWRASWSISDN